MLYVFLGDDVVRAKTEAMKRARDAQVVRVGENGEAYANAMSFVGAQGMFAPSVALILDRPLDDDDGVVLIEENGDALVSADTLVIAVVPELSATDKKKFPKGTTFEEFELPATPESPPPNVFALTDAYMAGDRKASWVTYRSLINAGVEPEMVHGTLAWAVRSMLLAGQTKTAAEAGMKDYTYNKAKRAVQKLGLDAATNASRALISVYDDARSGRGSMEDLIEIFLLKK
ncbi:MAG: hypothetical protein AAB573_05475 [Patescibacteria group bacterium]